MGKLRKIILERNQKIKDSYLEKIKSGNSSDSVIDEISKENDIGKFYVRSILKDQGVEIERKTTYERKDKEKLNERDQKIIDLFNAETDPDEIARKYNLTSTRVRQIVRIHLGDNVKSSSKIPALKASMLEIQAKLESGISYEKIVETYGKNLIKQIKYNIGYNIYKEALALKKKDIVDMFNRGTAPSLIAEKHKLNKNYVYLLLHNQGLRSRITSDEKEKRDMQIFEMSKKKIPVEKIAKKFDLTPTMVRIITNNIKKSQNG